MVVSQADAPIEPEPRQRATPTRAALGEVEFLFPDQNKRTSREPYRAAKQTKADGNSRAAIVKSRTARRGIPRLKPRRVKKKPIEESVALPTLPDVPTSLRTASAHSAARKVVTSKTETNGLDAVIPRLSVTAKKRKSVDETTPKKVSKLSNEPQKKDIKTVREFSVKAPVTAVAEKKAVADKKLVADETVVAENKTVTAKKTAKVTIMKPVVKKRRSEDAVTKGTTVITEKKKRAVRLAHLKPTPAHDLSTHGAHYFTVQVKAVTDRGAAESVSNSLRAKGFEPNVVLADIPKKGRYYRIRVGKFRSLEAARKFQKVLSARGASKDRGIVTRY